MTDQPLSPAAQAVVLTDQELLKLAAKAFGYAFVDGGIGGGESEFLAFARAIEDRLLKHRPYAAAGTTRQGIAAASAQHEPVAPTASDVTELFYRHMGEGSEVGFENAIAEALVRWGTPANNTREEN